MSTQNVIRRSLADSKDEEGPIKFSTSKAYNLAPEDSFYYDQSHKFLFEPYVISGCMAVFCIYFFILREENDIDEKLGSLEPEGEQRRYEMRQLVKRLEECEEKGIDDQEARNKLAHLYQESKKPKEKK